MIKEIATRHLFLPYAEEHETVVVLKGFERSYNIDDIDRQGITITEYDTENGDEEGVSASIALYSEKAYLNFVNRLIDVGARTFEVLPEVVAETAADVESDYENTIQDAKDALNRGA